MKINDFTFSIMAITTEIMVIMKINGLTHKIINFKKRKVMDHFYRNVIANDILKGF